VCSEGGAAENDGESWPTPRLLSAEELAEVHADRLKKSIAETELKLRAMQPNMRAIAEYRVKEREYAERVAVRDELLSSAFSLLRLSHCVSFANMWCAWFRVFVAFLFVMWRTGARCGH
jgi:hypothetical protein